MRSSLILLILLTVFTFCLAEDQVPPVSSHKIGISIPTEHLNFSNPSRTTYAFATPPVSLLTSYWDYMIGGYSCLPVHVQTSTTGNGVFLSYMGQRTSTGLRRVFVSYIDSNGNVAINNELSYSQIREGYISSDVDRVSGKPFFVWHSDADATDPELEVSASISPFPQQLEDYSFILIDNPISLTINGSVYADNEFIWPVIQIGPSPNPAMRRVYVFATNSNTHAMGDRASESAYYVYADFTQQMIEEGSSLTWSHATIPILDNWNTDQTAWRRLFQTVVIGNDGNIYMVGHHVALDSNSDTINEPYLDVFMNTNYGEGDWTQYSVNPDIAVTTPEGDSLKYCVTEGGHISGYVTPDNHVHFPLWFGMESLDGAYNYPLLQYLKDVDFNAVDHTFLIHDLYPAGIHPNDGNPVLPWDLNEDGIPDTNEEGEITYFPTWPFVYWDDTVLEGEMQFNYNTVRFTKMNEQGMVAAVWSSSLRAKFALTIPEFVAYPEVPEIFISVYPVAGSDGPQWSTPISLNSVETPELCPNNDPMIPEWPYPGDYIEYLGNSPEGYPIGRLPLMFYDDNSWGTASLSPAVGIYNGGKVMYTALNITWSPDNVSVIQEPAALAPVLLQNYPNPFNPTTTIAYNISKAGRTTLNVYNVKGQKVRSLVDEIKPVGNFNVVWNGLSANGSDAGSGIYFYRLESNGKSVTRKMVLLK